MKIYVLDIGMVALLVFGTILIKFLHSLVAKGHMNYGLFIFLTLGIGVVPLLLLIIEIAPYSAISVVLGGVCFFWFALLSSRKIGTT